MSKALLSYPENQRTAIATRRLVNGAHGARGNGFWGAHDYFEKKKLAMPGQMGVIQATNNALDAMKKGKGFVSGDELTRIVGNKPRASLLDNPDHLFRNKKGPKRGNFNTRRHEHTNRMRIIRGR